MRGIVYIAGSGRSGTTLLARLLGQIPGVVEVGELRYIWQRGLIDDERCGCGDSFSSCGFWGAVVERLMNRVPASRAAELAESVNQFRYSPMPGGQGSGFWPRTRTQHMERAEYRRYLEILYETISSELHQDVVLVDSSKSPTYLANLVGVIDVPVLAIHAVRDSRGVAMSLQRKRVRPETNQGSTLMYRATPFNAAADWFLTNGILEVASTRGGAIDWRQIRYEDLASDPVRVVESVLDDAFGVQQWSLGLIDEGGAVDLAPSHSVAGNPMRFGTGSVGIVPDTDWGRELSRADQLLVSAVTWPLLLRLGYRLWPKDELR